MRLQPVAVAAVAALLLGAPAALAQTTPDSTPPTAPSSPWAEAVGETPGLAAWWRLDEPDGPIAADRAGDNDGTYAPGVRLGATGLIAGDPDAAIALDARGAAFVDAGDVLDFPGFAPFTVEAWVAPGEFQSPYPRILQKDGVDENGNRQGYLVYLNKETGKLGFERWRDGEADVVTTPEAIALDRPTHVVAAYDGSTMRLFLDGALVAEAAAQRDLIDNDFGLRIGARSDGESPFYGILDEIAVYGAALDADAVGAHFAAGTSGGVVELQPFDPDAGAPDAAEQPAATAIAQDPAATEPAPPAAPAVEATPAAAVAQATDDAPADQTIIGPPAPTATPEAEAEAEATQPAVIDVAPAETPGAETPAAAETPEPAPTEAPAVATLAPAEPVQPTPTPAPELIPATTTDEVNFRAGPTTDTVIIATLPAGTAVEATGKIVDDFVQVVYEGRRGWIFADYLVYP